MENKLLIGLAISFLGLGLVSCASDGKTPYIGENGNWWVDSSDLGINAQGPQGSQGPQGPAGQDGSDGADGSAPYVGSNGNWWVDGSDLGIPVQGPRGSAGEDGQPGKSVTVLSVKKTATDGITDTYTITFSDDTTTTFTVTNGESITVTSIEKTNTIGLVDTYTITFSNGSTHSFSITNGKDGKNLVILSIEHTGTEGLIDRYTITYSDGSTFNFVVSNGKDGLTPFVGKNGDWWIGGTDTGVIVDGNKAQDIPLTFYSSGLEYKTVTFAGQSGYVVTGWGLDDFYNVLPAHYADMTTDEINELYSTQGLKEAHLVIPNYIGNIPVIGVSAGAKLNFGKVTLSRNTMFLGDEAFYNCSRLKEIDFHNAPIKAIPYDCFNGTSLASVKLPSSVTMILNRAFKDLVLSDMDFTNIKYIGHEAFNAMRSSFVYLPKTVEYVGAEAFTSTNVYLEHEEVPSNWASTITVDKDSYAKVVPNCKIDGDYLYSLSDNQATVHQYLGTERRIEVPATLGGHPVTKVGGGFASVSPTSAMRIWTEAYLASGKLHYGNSVDVIKLPDGIKEIEDFAFYSPSEMVIIPESVEKISETLFMEFDGDLDAFLPSSDPAWDVEASERYYAFEGDNLPSVIKTNGDVSTSWSKETVVTEDEFRASFGVDYEKLEFDDNYCYQNDGETYSLLSYLGLRTQEVVIPATFNDKCVTTVLANAFGHENYIKSITIESGIERIKPRAIACFEVGWVYIPASVSVINAKGINGGSIYEAIYIEHNDKPEDWDTNWTTLQDKVIYGVGEVKTNSFFRYSIKNNQVALVKYLGSSTNVMIPKEIDAMPVTEIKNGFFKADKKGASIYIPSTVTRIRANAFNVPSGKTFTFYCQVASQPDDWDSSWAMGSGDKSYNWNQFEGFDYLYSDNYVYMVSGDAAKLLAYAGNETTIYVPRTIDSKTVTSIKGYCFEIVGSSTVYIPQEVITIESYAFALRGSYNCYFKCEAESKPAGWAYYCWYNLSTNSQSYCQPSYSQIIE